MAQNLNLNLIIGDLKALQTNVTLRLDGEPTNIAIKTQTKALQTKGIFSTEKGGKGKDNDPLKDLDKASKDIKDAIEELTKNEQKVGKAFEDIIKAAQDLRCIEAGPCGHVFGDECSSLAQAAMSLLNVFDWGRDGKLSTVVKNLRGSGSVISFSYEDDVKDIYDVSEDVLKSLEKLGCFELTTATGQKAETLGQYAQNRDQFVSKQSEIGRASCREI